MSIVRLSTPEDPRLAAFRAVADPILVRERGLFVAEGRRVVAEVLEQRRFEVEGLLLSESAREALSTSLDALDASVDVFVVEGPAALRAVTGHRFHQGCLALVRLPAPWALDDLPGLWTPGPGVVVGLEGVTDPDNVGTIFRSACAFGARAVLLSPGCAHPLYRKAIRTSMATTLRLPFAWPTPWPGALQRLRDEGFRVLALTPMVDACDLRDALCERAVLLLGSEERGLGRESLSLADRRVRIPMEEAVDSLNVAAAAAIALQGLHASRGREAGV